VASHPWGVTASHRRCLCLQGVTLQALLPKGRGGPANSKGYKS